LKAAGINEFVISKWPMIHLDDCKRGENSLSSWVLYRQREFTYAGKELTGRSFLVTGQGKLSTDASNYIFVINDEYGFELYHMADGSTNAKYVPTDTTKIGRNIKNMPFFRLACILFGAPDNRSDKSGRFNLDNVVAEHYFEGNKSNVSLLSAHFTTYRENLDKQKGIARTLVHLGTVGEELEDEQPVVE
jgi:hypothetical protein